MDCWDIWSLAICGFCLLLELHPEGSARSLQSRLFSLQGFPLLDILRDICSMGRGVDKDLWAWTSDPEGLVFLNSRFPNFFQSNHWLKKSGWAIYLESCLVGWVIATLLGIYLSSQLFKWMGKQSNIWWHVIRGENNRRADNFSPKV